MVDVAQAAGALVLDLTQVDAIAGSTRKWLLGPPDVGFLGIAPARLDELHPEVRGLFAKVQVFDAKEDQMKFGTISFVRVRPGLLGLGTENGKPVLLLPGQVRRAPSSRPRPLATPPL